MTRQNDILLIGYGNTLRGDDGAGPCLAAAVAAWSLPNVTVLERHQLTPELAEPVSRAARVIFADAAVAPGGQSVNVSEVSPEAAQQVMYHTLSPAGLLGLAKSVFGHAPMAWLVSIPVTELGMGEGLSPQAEQAVQVALGRVRELVDR
jgi:hydrogenase maturation protease